VTWRHGPHAALPEGPESLRIGIDGACLANRRGFGRFTREVVAALGRIDTPHRFVVFVDRPSLDRVELPAGFEVVPVAVHEAPCEAASADGRRRLGDMLAVSRALARARLDAVYFPATYSFVPVWGVPRVVVTMHDTLPFRLPELVFPTRMGRLAWGIKEHLAVRSAHRIVTVSEASRRDLIGHFRLRPDRVRVIVEGVDPGFGPRAAGPASDAVLTRRGVAPGSRYLLYVGGLSPHKNLLRLLDAFDQVSDLSVRLVIVGDLGDVFHTHVPELRARIEHHGLGDRVTLTGFVPDAELAFLYNRAEALVQPSLLEGFGLPAAEAMACGTPVLFSRAGSLPEIVGDGGLGFDPLDVAAIRHALDRLLSEPRLRDDLAARALERSARFSWDESARGLLAAIEPAPRPRSLVAGSGPHGPGFA
jgi:glycosyltransferase involved in cell wall biosynthesis